MRNCPVVVRPTPGIGLSVGIADKPHMGWGSGAAAAADNRAPRVLIVNADESDRTFVERMLRQKGYETAVAAEGGEAIEIAAQHGPFDLLVTDAVLPGIHGDELARRLRLRDPDLKILYLTEHSDLLFEERPLLWEAEAFLDKPVSVQGLYEAVALILVGRIPPPRAARVRIAGARLRFEHGVANVESLSETGVLVDAAQAAPVGSTWSLVLELPGEEIRLTGRIVSCAPRTAPSGSPPSSPRFAIAMAFVRISTGAGRALHRVCTDAAQAARPN